MNINKEYSGVHGNMSGRSGGRGAIDYVVIHYTASEASARNNCIYFAREGAKTNASADFFIDRDGEIYQYNGNLDNYKSWHCGGGTSYGCTNTNSIGIECVSDGSDFTNEQINSLRELVGQLMGEYNISASHVIRHYDCNSIRKHCPAPYIDQDKWNSLHSAITGGEYVPVSNSSAVSNGDLDVDGVLGYQSIKRLQEAIGAPYRDGCLSGQLSSCQKYHTSLIACTYGGGGSASVKTLQNKIGVDADGIWGRMTSTALQKYLGDVAVDGYFGVQSAKSLQRHLNNGSF